MAGRAQLGLLHAFQLSSAGHPVDLPLTAQRLVAFLALHERPVRRTYVAGVLWPDASEERAASSLRSALWRLRRSARELVAGTVATLRLSPAVTVDVLASSRIAKDMDGRAPDLWSAAAGAELITRFDQDLLPDWYDDWLILWRERWHQIRLHALEVLATRLREAGSMAVAIEAGLAAVRAEPLRESGHYVLIEAHMAEGNMSEAFRQYDSYRSLLWREMRIAPSPRMQALTSTFTGR